jgi:hypothetical protein
MTEDTKKPPQQQPQQKPIKKPLNEDSAFGEKIREQEVGQGDAPSTGKPRPKG